MKGLSFEMRLLLSGDQRQTRSPRMFFGAGRGQDLPGEIWEFLGRVSSTIGGFLKQSEKLLTFEATLSRRVENKVLCPVEFVA
jgi:hypothetical protein